MIYIPSHLSSAKGAISTVIQPKNPLKVRAKWLRRGRYEINIKISFKSCHLMRPKGVWGASAKCQDFEWFGRKCWCRIWRTLRAFPWLVGRRMVRVVYGKEWQEENEIETKCHSRLFVTRPFLLAILPFHLPIQKLFDPLQTLFATLYPFSSPKTQFHEFSHTTNQFLSARKCPGFFFVWVSRENSGVLVLLMACFVLWRWKECGMGRQTIVLQLFGRVNFDIGKKGVI